MTAATGMAATTAGVTTATTATTVAWKSVFAAGTVVLLHGVAAAVAGLIALEVVELLRTASRHRTVVTVMRVVAVVHVSVEPLPARGTTAQHHKTRRL